MSDQYTEPVLHPDRIRGCAQAVRDYRVRIGGSSFEWADITGPLATVLDGMAEANADLQSLGLVEDPDSPDFKALVALLDAIEAAVRHT